MVASVQPLCSTHRALARALGDHAASHALRDAKSLQAEDPLRDAALRRLLRMKAPRSTTKHEGFSPLMGRANPASMRSPDAPGDRSEFFLFSAVSFRQRETAARKAKQPSVRPWREGRRGMRVQRGMPQEQGRWWARLGLNQRPLRCERTKVQGQSVA